MDKQIGTCGVCGGQVTEPTIWHGIYPPVPRCLSCGRTPNTGKTRTLPMNNDPLRTNIKDLNHD